MSNLKVDRNEQQMFAEYGTKCLITDVIADKYLEQAKKVGTERYSRWCGGTGGFDDFCERME